MSKETSITILGPFPAGFQGHVKRRKVDSPERVRESCAVESNAVGGCGLRIAQPPSQTPPARGFSRWETPDGLTNSGADRTRMAQ
jgi:hypothetical protein